MSDTFPPLQKFMEEIMPATWEVEGGSMELGLEVSIQTKFPEWLGLELE